MDEPPTAGRRTTPRRMVPCTTQLQTCHAHATPVPGHSVPYVPSPVNLGRPDLSGARQKGRSDFTLTDFEKNLDPSIPSTCAPNHPRLDHQRALKRGPSPWPLGGHHMSKTTTRPTRQVLSPTVLTPSPLSPSPFKGGPEWGGPISHTTEPARPNRKSKTENRKPPTPSPNPQSEIPIPQSLPQLTPKRPRSPPTSSPTSTPTSSTSPEISTSNPPKPSSGPFSHTSSPGSRSSPKRGHDYRETDLSTSLQTALDNLRRIIDSQAGDKIKVTAGQLDGQTRPRGCSASRARGSLPPRGGGRGWVAGISQPPQPLTTLPLQRQLRLDVRRTLPRPPHPARDSLPFFYDPIKAHPRGRGRGGFRSTCDTQSPADPTELLFNPRTPHPTPRRRLRPRSQLPL